MGNAALVASFLADVDEANVLVHVEGVRKFGTADKVTEHDLIHIGSCTKAMTAVMIASLVSDSPALVGWNTTLSDAMPEVAPVVLPAYQSITLWQLVNHTSGVPANALRWWDYRHKSDIIERRCSIIIDNLSSQPSVGIGTYLYSNLGYVVAACMIERLLGKSWEELMQVRVFRPLNMTTAGFGPPSGDLQPWGHAHSLFGWSPSRADNAPALGPAGTVHLSLQDWAKFLRVFLLKEELLLPVSELRALLTAPSPVYWEENPGLSVTAAHNTVASSQANVSRYRIGWNIVDRSWAGGMALTHTGSNTYWHCVVWVAPNTGRAIMAATNCYASHTFAELDRRIASKVQPPT